MPLGFHWLILKESIGARFPLSNKRSQEEFKVASTLFSVKEGVGRRQAIEKHPLTSVSFGIEELRAKEVKAVEGDYIAVASELPQLRILWQKELEDHFEVTVICYRDEATCPPCGMVTTVEQDRRKQCKQDRRRSLLTSSSMKVDAVRPSLTSPDYRLSNRISLSTTGFSAVLWDP